MTLTFTKERATPPDAQLHKRGRHRSELYLRIDELTPGEVLRVSGGCTWGRAWSCIAQVRTRKPGSQFVSRKSNGGLDIYRLA